MLVDIEKRVEQLERQVEKLMDSQLDDHDKKAINAFKQQQKAGTLLDHEDVFDN